METAFRQQSEQRTQPEPHAAALPASEEMKSQAENAWRGMKDIARARIGSGQQEMARGLGDLAGALRHAADEVDDARHATTAHAGLRPAPTISPVGAWASSTTDCGVRWHR